MEIEDKYAKMLGKYIYHKRLDKFGFISTIKIEQCIGGYRISLNAFCDTFDDDVIVFFEDFEKGEAQFTIITGMTALEKYNESIIKDIKEVFGDKYSDDMLLYIDDDERRKRIEEVDKREVQKLHIDLVSLTDIGAEIFATDFYSRELYKKYKNDIIDEKQMLYAVINHLAQENKRINKSNSDYFWKYEFGKIKPEIEI